MKIQLVESKSRKAIPNTQFQLQVRGKDSGTLTVRTDPNGTVTLDGKYQNQQIMATFNGSQSPWITASENATLALSPKAPSGGAGNPGNPHAGK